jgi:hypothetical protein
MFEVVIGCARIASGVAAVVITVIALADRLKNRPGRQDTTN